MIRYIRDLRIIPIALIATACLLALKTADFLLGGDAWLAGDKVSAGNSDAAVIRNSPDGPQASGNKLSWAQQMFNFPEGSGSARSPNIAPAPVTRVVAQRLAADRGNADITGSVTTDPARSDKTKVDDKSGKDAKDGKDIKAAAPASGTVIATDGAVAPSGAERAILERLQERRQELDTRARELDIRESLIKVAEKRMDAQLAELKEVEARINVKTQQKDDADAARFKGLVTMYENMKPRDAAKIFDRLETDVLLAVTSQINPRKMSDILAQMSPDMAERLTVELASKAQHMAKNGPPELPKIEGRPATP